MRMERERLYSIAAAIKPPDKGLIVRTVAEGCQEELLVEDLRFLLEGMAAYPGGALKRQQLLLCSTRTPLFTGFCGT